MTLGAMEEVESFYVSSNQKDRYWRKVIRLCAISGYNWSTSIYDSETEGFDKDFGLANHVCLQVFQDLLNQDHSLIVNTLSTVLLLSITSFIIILKSEYTFNLYY